MGALGGRERGRWMEVVLGAWIGDDVASECVYVRVRLFVCIRGECASVSVCVCVCSCECDGSHRGGALGWPALVMDWVERR